MYKGGQFSFTFAISANFPHDPPKVKCTQKLYHPNIDYEGNVCLNILREDWKPVLSLNAIFFGLLVCTRSNLAGMDRRTFDRQMLTLSFFPLLLFVHVYSICFSNPTQMTPWSTRLPINCAITEIYSRRTSRPPWPVGMWATARTIMYYIVHEIIERKTTSRLCVVHITSPPTRKSHIA